MTVAEWLLVLLVPALVWAGAWVSLLWVVLKMYKFLVGYNHE